MAFCKVRVCIVSGARCGRSNLTRYFGRAEVQRVAAATKKIILAAQDLPVGKKDSCLSMK